MNKQNKWLHMYKQNKRQTQRKETSHETVRQVI